MFVYSWENILISSNFSAFGPRRWSIFGVFIRLNFLLIFFGLRPQFITLFIFSSNILLFGKISAGSQCLSICMWFLNLPKSFGLRPKSLSICILQTVYGMWHSMTLPYFFIFFKILFTKWPADKFSQSLSSFLLNK